MLVSIGMPVYNGEKYIRQALDSLLAQDYENFELIISDNASTDRTAEICLDYVAKDKRVKYHRNETNLGALKNFNQVVNLSRGKYFLWAADHDLWHSTFISRCVSVLEQDSEIVLAYARTRLISIDGTDLGLTPDVIDTRGMPAFRRYLDIIWNLSWCNMIYGVIRRKVLCDEVWDRENIVSWDHAVLAALALRGTFAQIPEPLFFRRQNRPDEDPETYKRRVLYNELLHAHLKIITRAPIGFLEKLYLGILTRVCFIDRFGVRYPSMRHRLFEAIVNRFPQLFWLFKTKSFLADPWQRRIFPQHQWLLKIVKRKKPESILEAGCGFGRNLDWLIKQGIKPASLTGVDISSRLLAQARLPKQVSLIQDNVLSLKFKDNSFALVFTHGLLMHLSPRQLPKALAELVRVSKKYLIMIEEIRTRPRQLNYFTWAHDYDKMIKTLPLKVLIKKIGKYSLVWYLLKK